MVDDNSVNRIVAQRMLARLGYDSDLVEDGEKACQHAAQQAYALILMNCMMPVLDATERLRSEGLTTRIVAMTANARPEDKARCLAAGMDEHLAKPIRLKELRRILNQTQQ